MPNSATTSTSNSTPATIPNELDATVENAWRPIRDSPLKLKNMTLNRVTAAGRRQESLACFWRARWQGVPQSRDARRRPQTGATGEAGPRDPKFSQAVRLPWLDLARGFASIETGRYLGC